jgi:hypothetical protein
MSDAMKATAKKLAAYCRENKTAQGLDELYDADAVSVEAMPLPGSGSAEITGIEGIKGKHDWWASSFEVHSQVVEGPFAHGGDRFALIFAIDATNRESGERNQMKEVGIYTVNEGGKVIREEFFY